MTRHLLAERPPAFDTADVPCRRRRVDPDLWHPPIEQKHVPDVQLAIALCRTCPLLEPCRAYALAHQEHGIWGATTTEERQAARQLQGRGTAPRCPSEKAYRRHLVLGQDCPACRALQVDLKRRRQARHQAAKARKAAA